MRRVLRKRERGVAGFGSCGHQPGTLGRPPQAERQQERAGTPVDQAARQGEANARRQEAPAQVSLLATGTGSYSSSRALRSSGRREFDPRAGSYAFTPRRVSDARQPKSPLLAKCGGALPPDAESSLRNAVIGSTRRASSSGATSDCAGP